jgi:hypothetical protein
MLPRLLLLSLEFTCIVLAVALVYLFFKVYKTQRSVFLLGLPLGFLFLTFSSSFLGAHIIILTFQAVNPFSSSIMWMRVITQSVGFVLITLSYIFASRLQETSKRSYLFIFLGATSLVASAFMVLFLLEVAPQELLTVYSYNDVFAVFNLSLLSFIILFLTRKLQLVKRKFVDLVGAPVAFFFLWVGQLSFLIWSFADGGDLAQVMTQVARVVAFAIFVQIYYMASKEAATDTGKA